MMLPRQFRYEAEPLDWQWIFQRLIGEDRDEHGRVTRAAMKPKEIAELTLGQIYSLLYELPTAQKQDELVAMFHWVSERHHVPVRDLLRFGRPRLKEMCLEYVRRPCERHPNGNRYMQLWVSPFDKDCDPLREMEKDIASTLEALDD
jgi:hypothetical protein